MSPGVFLVVLLAALAGLVIGTTIHELSHYLVLALAGRSPTLRWPSLDGQQLLVQCEFDIPASHVPRDVRLAAVAPVAVGGVVGAVGGIAVAVSAPPAPVWAFIAVTTVWTLKLSPEDRRLATCSYFAQ